MKIEANGRYRKLTPKEYFRLMGFHDSDYERLVESGFSKTQLYKMAGNSIVVPVLECLFKQLYCNDKNALIAADAAGID